MCGTCSRRGFIGGIISSTFFPPIGHTEERGQIICGFASTDEYETRFSTMASKSGNKPFDDALIAELKNIHRLLPINPGFKFMKASNAFATNESVVAGTQGTVWIGLDFVNDLIKAADGGISVAGVLAHECAHIFQFFDAYSYYTKLTQKGVTSVLVELHADFLTGYYLGAVKGLPPSKLSPMQTALLQMGTFNRKDPKFHGTGPMRAVAMERGYFASQDKMKLEEAAKLGETYVAGLLI
jgi:hypothetical protein